MNTKLVAILSFIFALFLVIFSILILSDGKQVDQDPSKEASRASSSHSPKDAMYFIDGRPVTLRDGVSVEPAAPGSASSVTTRYFGNELAKDLNGDGLSDLVFLVTQDGGGSGTFYYVVAALTRPDGTFSGSHAVFLGDRIAPQTINDGGGNIVLVNYAVRGEDEPFSVAPSIGKTLRIILDPTDMQFGVVAENFEGEADPSRMTLAMKTWVWEGVTYADGKTFTPRAVGRFTAQFGAEKRFSASTDCNGAGAEYTEGISGALSFGPMFSTQMYCEGSEEQVYTGLLEKTVQYRFTSKGMLELVLSDGTIMHFR